MIRKLFNLYRSPAYQLVLVLAIVCIALQYAGLTQTLQYQRSLIANGQWWLLLTGNFVHLGTSHLWMNMAGLGLVVALVWQHYSALQWFTLIIICSVGVGVGLWFFNPGVAGYVGFSGTLHGLILAGALADLRTYPRSATVLLLLVVGKLIWEQLRGSLPGSASVAGGVVMVDAHMYGAITGTIVGLILIAYNIQHAGLEAEPETENAVSNQ